MHACTHTLTHAVAALHFCYYYETILYVSSLITRDLDHLDTEGFLTYLPTLTNGIMGFFIVEDALMRKVDHKEGLLSPQQASHTLQHLLLFRMARHLYVFEPFVLLQFSAVYPVALQ
jgi:hypothetical protein